MRDLIQITKIKQGILWRGNVLDIVSMAREWLYKVKENRRLTESR